MVLFSLEVHPIKLCNSSIWAYNLAVSQESPHLSQCHRETFFRFLSFDLPSVDFVPRFELAIVPKQDILDFLLNILGIWLKLDQIWNINQCLKWILFNFLLSSVSCCYELVCLGSSSHSSTSPTYSLSHVSLGQGFLRRNCFIFISCGCNWSPSSWDCLLWTCLCSGLLVSISYALAIFNSCLRL